MPPDKLETERTIRHGLADPGELPKLFISFISGVHTIEIRNPKRLDLFGQRSGATRSQAPKKEELAFNSRGGVFSRK